jgi:1,4-alpha-glucan branching enzyme
MSTIETSNIELGAHIHETGVSFAVWAPNASAVSVVGEFNQWDPTTNPCERVSGGNWLVFVEGAKAGQGYKFWIKNGDAELLRIDPRARQVTNSVGHGVIVDERFDWGDDHFVTPPFNEMVIYELHIGTFNSVDGSVGSFATACERLSHLKELGVNAIELMPLTEFAGDYSWGYNPAHPFSVETAYGGPNELRRFVREAHRHGIAVIVDVVYNHFGPSDLDLWQFDGWSENGKGGIYFYNDWRSSTPWGDTRPDYGRGEVRQYIYDNAMMWLQEFRADGLRYDMTLYMRSVDGSDHNEISDGFSLAQWINREIKKNFPGKVTIAEDLQNNRFITECESLGGANFSSQWDANFVHPIRDQIIQINDELRSMNIVRAAIEHKYNLDVFQRVIYTESHDEVANGKQHVVSEIDPNPTPNRYAIKRSTLGACVMMTAPGIPMLMQGQEFLRDKWFSDSRPIDWNRCQTYSTVVLFYHDLIELRRNLKQCSAGLTGQNVDVFHLDDSKKVLAMHRWKDGGPGDDVVAIFKFSEFALEDYRIGFPRGGLWLLRFNGDAKVYGDAFDGTQLSELQAEPIPSNGMPYSAVINIGAYSCLIFSQDRGS